MQNPKTSELLYLAAKAKSSWWVTVTDFLKSKPWAWVFLMVAILLEVAGTTCMRLSNSYKKLVPSILFVVFYTVSTLLLPPVAEGLGLGLIYVIWSGVGSLLTVLIGRFLFKETVDMWKGIGMVLVMAGAMLIGYVDGITEETTPTSAPTATLGY